MNSKGETFRQWLRRRQVRDNPYGDFIADTKRLDRRGRLPEDFDSAGELRDFMSSVSGANVCYEAYVQATHAFFKFKPEARVYDDYIDGRDDDDEQEDDEGSAQEAYGRSRRGVPPKLRFAILRRDEFRCRLCGASAATGATLHVDHCQPVAKGGTDAWDNLWTLCLECNQGKGTDELT
jgi:hypothetical protein